MRRHDRAGEAAAPTFGGSVERGLQLVVGLVIAAKTIVFAFEIASRPNRDAAVLVCAAVVVACVGTAAYLCLRGRSGLLGVALATIALVAGALLPRDTVPLAGASDSPILHLVEPMLLAILANRRAPLLIAGLDVLFVCLRWSTGGRTGLQYGVQEALFITGTVLGALVLVRQMRSASARAEAALEADRSARQNRLSRAEVEATSALHDDVIPALLALSAGEPTDATRNACVTALEAIGARSASARERPVVDQIRLLARGTGIAVDVSVQGRPMRRLPDEVHEAMASAVRESLRNVARHSGVDRAEVRLVRGPRSITITVRDEGVGFAGPPGVGQRIAVIERMRTVDGTAAIRSAPGSGTTVELAWRAPSQLAHALGWSSDTDRLTRLALGPPAIPALLPVLALACGYFATAVLVLPDAGPQPATYLGALAVACIVTGLAMRMQRGPMTPPILLTVAALTATILALVLPTVSLEGLGGLESWIIEFTALPTLVLAWLLSIRVTVLMLVPNAVVIAVVALHEGLPSADLPHLLFVQPLNALFVAVIASVCRRAGQVVDVAGAGGGLAARAGAARAVLAGRRPVVVAALTAGAHGEPPTVDAARVARAVRDCLYLPGPSHAALRATLDELRARGAQVETSVRELPQNDERLAGVLRALGGATGQRITLTTSADSATIVVVPGVGGAHADRLRAGVLAAGWTIVEDADATVVTSRAALLTPSGGPLCARG